MAAGYADLLRAHGHEVRAAADGPQASEIAAQQHFDLFLCDLMMPGMRGDELLRHLKAQPRPWFWFVLMTPTMDARLKQRIAGCDGYLEKPFRPEALSQFVAACAAWAPFVALRIRRAA